MDEHGCPYSPQLCANLRLSVPSLLANYGSYHQHPGGQDDQILKMLLPDNEVIQYIGGAVPKIRGTLVGSQ